MTNVISQVKVGTKDAVTGVGARPLVSERPLEDVDVTP